MYFGKEMTIYFDKLQNNCKMYVKE